MSDPESGMFLIGVMTLIGCVLVFASAAAIAGPLGPLAVLGIVAILIGSAIMLTTERER